MPDFIKHLQRLDGKWGTTYNRRWDLYNRVGRGNDYTYGCPNRDPTKKDPDFLRDFVCSVRLASYFIEYDAYWQAHCAAVDRGHGAAVRSQDRGPTSGSSPGASSWWRPRSCPSSSFPLSDWLRASQTH